jgi:hypothetical protein
MMKKKVRYAAGALGALGVMPALALVTPGAAAAAQAPPRTGKTVSLAPLVPAATCTGTGHAKLPTNGNGMDGVIVFSKDNGCIYRVDGFVPGAHSSLSMRVRYYKGGAQYGPTHYVGWSPIGTNSISTVWVSSPNPRPTSIGKVCEAIVSPGMAHKVKYGPVCESTGHT